MSKEIQSFQFIFTGQQYFGNIGYRHVSNKGFLFRAGFSPSFTLGEKNAVKKAFFFPYLGFGWAF